MELRVLRYFLVVAEEENITRAAALLHVTQPTLSRQLQDLEEELGVELFTRGKKRTVLTDDGRFLYRRAKEIVELSDRTEASFRLEPEKVEGDIFIGAGESKGMQEIAELMAQFGKKYPRVTFHLHSGNAEDLSERLENGLIDFALFIEYEHVDRYEHVDLASHDRWGILMKKDSKLADKAEITCNDLRYSPLVISRQALDRGAISSWLGSENKYHIKATYNLLFNAALLVQSGIGYAVCLENLVDTTGQNGLCFRPLSPEVLSPLSFAWKKNQVFSRSAKLFLEELVCQKRS